MKRLYVLCVAITLTACAASGVQVDQTKLSQFKVGQSTYTEVTTALGQPTNTTTLSDGRKIAIYAYAQAAARPETFIPVVGAFVGGADARTSSVMFEFDGSGVLTRYSSTQGQYGSGTGFASGVTPAERVDQQPRRD